MVGRVISLRYEADRAERLDRFLAESLPDLSRARLQGFIRRDLVFVNGIAATKAGQMIKSGSTVEVRVPAAAPTTLEPEHTPLDIIFEDEDVIVVNKPAGMVVHPAAGHTQGTLANAVLGHDPQMEGIGGEDRPGVVHRLDKDTSGLILLAKNDRALRWLQDQFSGRHVRKTYVALVDGRPPTPTGRVETVIGRDRLKRKQMAVVPDGNGREAVSQYRTLEAFSRHTLLEFEPTTGRTHQIRVHCAFLGCPIVGDTVYGFRTPSIAIRRHFLHAIGLEVTLPGARNPTAFRAALPKELETVLEHLRTATVGKPQQRHTRRAREWTS